MLILPIQAGQRPTIVIKDKDNSLLITKLHSGTVAGGTVTGISRIISRNIQYLC